MRCRSHAIGPNGRSVVGRLVSRISLCAIAWILFAGAASWCSGQAEFSRGDVNQDSAVDIADPIATIGHLFFGGSIPCEAAADVNDDGLLDVADVIGLLSYLHMGGTAPPDPFPGCGFDPTPSSLPCSDPGVCGTGLEDAPCDLTYSTPVAFYIHGTPIAPNIPIWGCGTPDTYAVVPPLPSGLDFDPATGLISGTPLEISGPSSHAVTAENLGGSAVTLIWITVHPAAPCNLVYSDPIANYSVGTPIFPNFPSVGCGAPFEYSIDPALPAGLTLDSFTGVINGVPQALTPATIHLITAENFSGDTVAAIQIEVSGVLDPPCDLEYSEPVASYTVGVPIVDNPPSNGCGAIDEYSVSPPLPAGLTLDRNSGVIGGTPSSMTAAAIYTVTGSNAAGSTTVDLTIVVHDVLPPDFPTVTMISPNRGKPGDILTLGGCNFSPSLAGNSVTFSNFAHTVSIRGLVETVTVGVAPPGEGVPSTLTVRVPSGVRSGFLALSVVTPTGKVDAAMLQSSFSGAPVLTGAAVNDDGQGIAVLRDVAANLVTNSVVLIGYNLGASVTTVEVDDGSQLRLADDVTPGLPVNATYSLGEGLEAIVVDLPSGLFPSGCATSVLTFLATSDGGSGSPLSSGPFEMPYAVVNPASFSVSDIPAHFTGAITPAGIRSGDVELTFNLVSSPADARWDVVIEYQDPTDPTGNTFIPCTPAAGSLTGALVLTGTPTHPSLTPGIIGPGVTYHYRWDSASDLPAGSGTAVTRMRLRPTNPIPVTAASSSPCVGSLLTDCLVIDNSVASPGAIVEEFEDNSKEDPISTALWNPNDSGILTSAPGGSGTPNWGTGTVDVVLQVGRSYLVDTEIGSIIDDTDPFTPIDVLAVSDNPGSSMGEVHLRSFVTVDGAIVTVAGASPLVIRCSGDGTDSFLAAQLEGEIHLDGLDAIAGTATDRGSGGAGGPGGGDGGDGGFIVVDVNSQSVISVESATPGELNGGEAGTSASWISFGTSTSLPKGGPGGGGGQGEPGVPLGTSWVNVSRGSGEDGVNTYSSTTSFKSPVGRGGFPHGDSAITNLRGGSGGGGGGGVPIRLTTPTSLAPKHGGGGGGGGGAFSLTARGSVVISGTIHCDGGNGSKGTAGNPGTQSGAGGGGAGGAIVFRATGDIALTQDVQLTCLGGFGAVTSSGGPNVHRGGDGASGRIRFEANGQILAPGVADLTGVTPPMATGGAITSGQSASGAIQVGTGIDGPLDFTVLGSSGTFRIDTDLGKIFDATATEVFSNASGTGEFELTSFQLPEGVTLVAHGDAPLIFRVTGTTDLRGTIDVSGQDGGIPDFTGDPTDPTPALGGLAGAGGGDGGDGGDADNTTVGLAAAGGMPPPMPAELIDSGPPIGGGGGGGDPTPGDLAIPAQPGESLIGTGVCASGSGGGGGYGVGGQDGITAVSCPEAGIGGTPFGSTFWLVPDPNDPLSSISTLFGGGGGAGGGGHADGTAAAPGTGGGGAGGFVQISSGGELQVHTTSVIRARGGRAFRAPTHGGNGGGGAGGAIRIQGGSTVGIQAGSQFDVTGGPANQDPIASGLNPTYSPSVSFAGGDGGSGRIRIETPLGFSDATGVVVDPPFTAGSFATAGLTESRAVTLPYPVSVDGVTFLRPAMFGAPFVDFASPLPPDAHLIVLFEGACADPTDSGKPGTFFGLVDDPSFLNGVDFIRGQYFLYSSATRSPEVESIVLPFD